MCKLTKHWHCIYCGPGSWTNGVRWNIPVQNVLFCRTILHRSFEKPVQSRLWPPSIWSQPVQKSNPVQFYTAIHIDKYEPCLEWSRACPNSIQNKVLFGYDLTGHILHGLYYKCIAMQKWVVVVAIVPFNIGPKTSLCILDIPVQMFARTILHGRTILHSSCRTVRVWCLNSVFQKDRFCPKVQNINVVLFGFKTILHGSYKCIKPGFVSL